MASETTSENGKSRCKRGNRRGPWDWRHDAITFGLIDLVFDFPALIPETWLNYVGPDKTEADERHLAENPSRVDFVVFVEGRKYVIEIDGPSHYADFDEQERTYTVSEERYAKNLAIERSLRRQGWEINRFANVEVMRASGDDFVRLLVSAELPGLVWSDDPLFHYKDRPRVYESTVGAVLELFVR